LADGPDAELARDVLTRDADPGCRPGMQTRDVQTRLAELRAEETT